MLPSGSDALAVKVTASGATPLLVLAAGAHVGGRFVTVLRRNHGVAVGSVLKKLSSCCATFGTPPLVEGCVKSDSRSEHIHLKLSERGVMPSAQRYGPHASHGATTGPLFVLKLSDGSPLSCFSMSHLTEKPEIGRASCM